MRTPASMHLSVQTQGQIGPSRRASRCVFAAFLVLDAPRRAAPLRRDRTPGHLSTDAFRLSRSTAVTFALPPSPRLREDGLLASGSGTTPPVTPPAFDRANPFGASAAASPSGASFLSRLSRKLSVGKSSLSRRASKGSRRGPEPELASPQVARGVSFAQASGTESASRCECNSTSLSAASPERPTATGLGLRRSLRVGHASALRRAKSEGNAPPRRSRAALREPTESAVPLQRRATGGGHRPAAGREVRPQTAETHSNQGSYFWSDSLGVCWDGRERGASLARTRTADRPPAH